MVRFLVMPINRLTYVIEINFQKNENWEMKFNIEQKCFLYEKKYANKVSNHHHQLTSCQHKGQESFFSNQVGIHD